MSGANHGVWLQLHLIGAVLMVAGGCSGPSLQQRAQVATGPTPAERLLLAKLAVTRLQAGDFEAASQEAGRVLSKDPQNTQALLVRAITRYKAAMHQLSTDVRTVVFGAFQAGGFNHRYMRSSLTEAEQALAQVSEDLAKAWTGPELPLELCLACWEVDWNHNGRMDSADRWVFAIEEDAAGERIPDEDPRRKPTFRFDRGDIAWARAFTAFQQALLDILLAYKWTELDRILGSRPDRTMKSLRVVLETPALMQRARRLILEGLERADEARRAYLAEIDDDREWLPNPRQKNHPLPLPVDEALYRTWDLCLGDLGRLLRSEEGLSVEEIAQLGDHRWDHPPKGFVDIGRMLAQPKDIVLDIDALKDLDKDQPRDMEALLRMVLGDYYVASMKPTPLIGRLLRMKSEIDKGQESLERKLRYLFWLN